jgi:hypothetical protein
MRKGWGGGMRGDFFTFKKSFSSCLVANLAQFHHFFHCKDTRVNNYYIGSNYRLAYFKSFRSVPKIGTANEDIVLVVFFSMQDS